MGKQWKILCFYGKQWKKVKMKKNGTSEWFGWVIIVYEWFRLDNSKSFVVDKWGNCIKWWIISVCKKEGINSNNVPPCSKPSDLGIPYFKTNPCVGVGTVAKSLQHDLSPINLWSFKMSKLNDFEWFLSAHLYQKVYNQLHWDDFCSGAVRFMALVALHLQSVPVAWIACSLWYVMGVQMRKLRETNGYWGSPIFWGGRLQTSEFVEW